MVSGTGPDESGKYCVKNMQDHVFETNRATSQRRLEKFQQALALNLRQNLSENTGTTPRPNLAVLVREKWKLATSMVFLIGFGLLKWRYSA